MKSPACPGRKVKPAGFSKWKAMVPAATSLRLFSLISYFATEFSLS